MNQMKIVQQDFDINTVLNKPLMAHLSSLGNSGPCSSPIWFIYEENKIWLFGLDTDSFIKRLIKHNKCALSIVDFNLKNGILQHVGIRGVAIVNDIDEQRLHRFVSKYLGHDNKNWNQWFVNNVVNPLNRMVAIIPDTLVAKDVSYFKTEPDMASNSNSHE